MSPAELKKAADQILAEGGFDQHGRPKDEKKGEDALNRAIRIPMGGQCRGK